jgi:hypothetical protein
MEPHVIQICGPVRGGCLESSLNTPLHGPTKRMAGVIKFLTTTIKPSAFHIPGY